jgi:hypothetical protein
VASIAELEYLPRFMRRSDERVRVLWRLAPVICAGAYPFASQVLSQLLVAAHGSAVPNGTALWAGIGGSLLLGLAVMAVAFTANRVLSGSNEFRSRVAAHIAFATPSLFVGFGNAANILHTPAVAAIGWPLFWAALALAVLAPARRSTASPGISPAGYRRLGVAHGISACVILLLFLVPHLGNHASGLLNGATHIEIMKTARLIYRAPAIEPLLFVLIGFQIASGSVLVQRRLRSGSDFFGTLQSMTGVYVGLYFIAHLIAVLGARHAGTDTNWNWLTSNDHSMLTSLSSLRLIAHYWFGPVTIAAHLGCGLRLVLLQHQFRGRIANLAPPWAIGGGVAVSSVILVGLLGVHIA